MRALQPGWELLWIAKFVQAGLALAEIRRDQRYREEYDSFEAYCRDKWQYGRDYVDRLISAAQVFSHLLTNCQHQPEHESQVRPLVGLTPEQVKEEYSFADFELTRRVGCKQSREGTSVPMRSPLALPA
ncbi:MAG: hypothetical protein AB9869_13340 [Verrucomicrobiia bacterium]